MIFPELTGRIAGRLKSAFAGFGAPEPLNLKNLNFSFDPVTLKDMRLHPQVYSILGAGAPTWSGEAVSIASALNHSVVWACDRVVSEPVGFLPLAMLRRKGSDTQPAAAHPMYTALHDAPNDEITAAGFRAMLTSQCLLGGNAYAQIIRRSGTQVAMELRPLLPGQVWPDREKSGQKRLTYTVKTSGEADKTYTLEKNKPQDILHLRGRGWDGIKGYSVIAMGRNSIGTAIAAEHHVANFYAAGGRTPYNLKITKKFKDDQEFEKFRADWNRIYANPHEVPMLEQWLEYEKTGLSMVECQMLESRLFSIAEICRWFNVSPYLVGELSRATFSNIEHLGQSFVTFTLQEWFTRWEQELWRCVLTPEEKSAGYFFRHNVNALLRGDFLARMQGYSIALQNGFRNPNEVRALEDENAFDGGDDYHIQLNMQTLPGGAPTASQQAQLAKLGTAKKGAYLQ